MNGGAGVVVTRGNPTSPKVVKTIRRRGARFTCSYDEENRALEEAVHWLQTGVTNAKLFSGSVHGLPILFAVLLRKFADLDPHRFNLK